MQETEHLVHFKLLVFVFAILPSIFLRAQKFPISRVDSLLKSGIKNIVSQDYISAEKNFNTLNTEYPLIPLGKIYLVATKIAQAYDYAEEYDEDFIESELDSAKEIAKNILDSNDNNIWANYYYALAEGYSAYFDALNDNWLPAISTGFNSITAFGTCLNLNNNFYDAYIAIGTYEYWMSRKTDFLNGLPFYEDNSDSGIAKLETAIDKFSYNSYLAINSLIWIYINKENYSGAIELGEKAVRKFPNSRYFKWGLARAYEDIDPDKSIKLYFEILNSFPLGLSQNHINEIVLKHLIAQQYVKMGKRESALSLCNEILSLGNLTDFELSKLGNRLERVKELKGSLSN